MMVEGRDFVEWRETFVSQERGSRVVHYYLVDSSGDCVRAVIGTERSVRHMFYVMATEFADLMGLEHDGSGSTLLKWRSRREVVDWLTSFLPRQNFQQQDCSKSPINDLAKSSTGNKFTNGLNEKGSFYCRKMNHFNCNSKGINPDIVWSGNFWTTGKQQKHYRAFCRSGIIIPRHSFVLVMSKDEVNCYLAYLEEMYEDKKGQKKVKVRWFHRHQEVAGAIPPPKPHPNEAFVTPYLQVISAECVDDRAIVLTPEHYEKCMAARQQSFPLEIYVCNRLYTSKNKFRSFNVSSLSGYFDQSILSCLDISTPSGDDEEFAQDANGKSGLKRIRSVRGRQRIVANHDGLKMQPPCDQETSGRHDNQMLGLPAKRPLAVKFIGPKPGLSSSPPFKIEDKIELLCQDSGIRGCWFRCTILQVSQKCLRVQYDDVQNDDETGKLEEWIPAFRLAAPDKLGMRCSGRPMLRPSRLSTDSDSSLLAVGNPVDIWWNDGWWEGVAIGVDDHEESGLQVYLPGEGLTVSCQRKDLRISKDWVVNKWIDVEAKPDILSIISAVSPGAKLSTSSMSIKGSDSGGSPVSKQEAAELKTSVSEEEMKAAHTLSGLLMENMKIDNPKKRCREGEELHNPGEVKVESED